MAKTLYIFFRCFVCLRFIKNFIREIFSIQSIRVQSSQLMFFFIFSSALFPFEEVKVLKPPVNIRGALSTSYSYLSHLFDSYNESWKILTIFSNLFPGFPRKKFFKSLLCILSFFEKNCTDSLCAKLSIFRFTHLSSKVSNLVMKSPESHELIRFS